MLTTAIRSVLNLFSSIWLGIFLILTLFIYSSVGSSGVPMHPNIFNPASWVAVRELRAFELTEFEWFHWWPFDLLIGLICLNLTVTTLRRIPLNLVNLGVWMIHGGIIVLCLGSVYYFTTKVEGDAPVLRRQVVVDLPDGQRVTMPALPGAQRSAATPDGRYSFRITSIDPNWELLSGDDQGAKAYSVNLSVQTPTNQYIRQLIAGYPQYTEDLVRTDDPQQPFKRAVKELGTPLVDETLKAELAYAPQDVFYLMQSHAIYLRELGSTEWVMRPIEGLPRFNDYIASHDQVWISAADRDAAGMPTIPLDPIDVTVPSVDPGDPLAGVDLHVTGFLRYAFEESRREPGDGPIDPLVRVRLQSDDGQSIQHELAAFDPRANTGQGGLLSFQWADTAQAREALQQASDPVLHFHVPEFEVDLEVAVREFSADDPDLPFTPIEGTPFSYRVTGIQDGLTIRPGITDSVAIVEIKEGDSTFTRWVFQDESLTRDLTSSEVMSAHDEETQYDPRIQTHYIPGRRPAPVTIIAGPGERDLGLLLSLNPGPSTFQPLEVGQAVSLDPAVSMTVTAYHPRTTMRRKPAIVPEFQRDRQIGPNASMIQLRIPDRDDVKSAWLGFHQYAFDRPDEVLRRFPYQPRVISLADGRQVEFMFSRQRLALPAPVALDDFVVATHVGGFTGSTSSIRDWTSMVTFHESDDWTTPGEVHMNAPMEHEGYWFFQAQWDPPDPPRFQGDVGSNGLNYTVLGVGNRNGVIIQLVGCCISVFGMIWAFYVKPMLKRHRQQAVYVQVRQDASASGRIEADETESRAAELVANMEEQV